MKDVSYPVIERKVAEIVVRGVNYKFRIPPIIGTHQECFSASNSNEEIATEKGIAVYVTGALDPERKNEWIDQERIRFPTLNYLRVPAVLTIVPKRKEFGDLEGAMLVDKDLKGKGIAMKTKVPADLSDWKVLEGGILKKGSRIVVPYDKWYKEQWDENNGAVIALFGEEGGEIFERAAIDSGRNYRPLWKVNPNEITTPERRVPVVYGDAGGRLGLGCGNDGNDRGMVVLLGY